MKKNTSRILLFISLAIPFFTVLSGLIINIITGDTTFTDWVKTNIAETKGLIIGAIIITVVLLFLTYLYDKYSQHSEQPVNKDTITENIEPYIREFFDKLKERYQKRYQSKLDGRFPITLEVSDDFDSPSRSITEQFDGNATKGEAIEVIRQAFEQKGRLLIAGNAGVGKTVLLLKLAIDLLDKIEDLEKEPFPVIFNLASWSEEYENFGDWLKAMLVSGYGFSRAFAETVLQQERIIFLLDGLDELARNETKEIAADKRAACLASLNEYLSGERKAVICSRIEEFLAMRKQQKQDAPVSAKVRVLNLTPKQVLDALKRAANDKEFKHHTSANNLLKMFETGENENLLQVLRTPFYFTTAMEVFDRQRLNNKDLSAAIEELKPKTMKETGNYLVEKFVGRKLNNPLSTKNFASQQALKWLGWLARFLERKQQIVFELADLQPNDLNGRKTFNLLLGVLAAVSWDITFTYGFMLSEFLPDSQWTQLISPEISEIIGTDFYFLDVLIFLFGTCLTLSPLFLFLGIFFGFRTKIIVTEDINRVSLKPFSRWKVWKDVLLTSVFYSLITFFFTAALFWTLGYMPLKTVIFMPVIVFSFALMERISNHSRIIIRLSNLSKPYQRLKAGIIYTIIRWNFVLLFIVLMENLYEQGISWHILSLRQYFFLIPFALILSFSNTAIVKHLILRVCFNLVNAMPLKYATFLDYAAEARILEKDGGQWRFRHQNLQEYFASLDNQMEA